MIPISGSTGNFILSRSCGWPTFALGNGNLGSTSQCLLLREASHFRKKILRNFDPWKVPELLQNSDL